MSEELKKEFRKPYGKIYSSINEIKIPQGVKLITVGDVVSYNAIKSGLKPDVIVYDGKEKRLPLKKQIIDIVENYDAEKFFVVNPPSCVTDELWNIVKKCLLLNLRSKIFVNGEEDLAVLPFALEYPENTVILHGLVNQGIVAIEVDKNIKDKCRELVKQMEDL